MDEIMDGLGGWVGGWIIGWRDSDVRWIMNGKMYVCMHR